METNFRLKVRKPLTINDSNRTTLRKRGRVVLIKSTFEIKEINLILSQHIRFA